MLDKTDTHYKILEKLGEVRHVFYMPRPRPKSMWGCPS